MDEFKGWAKNLADAPYYMPQTSPCDLDDYVSKVQPGDGYYISSYNNGWCRTIPAAHVAAIRAAHAAGGDQWTHSEGTFEQTGLTVLPLAP